MYLEYFDEVQRMARHAMAFVKQSASADSVLVQPSSVGDACSAHSEESGGGQL